MNEKISAFLDNEATTDEIESVVDKLLRDETLRASWTRQHWIREVMRTPSGESAPDLDMDFSKRVMQAVQADQPAGKPILTPVASDQPQAAPSGQTKVVSMPQASQAKRGRRRLVAGFAVAASAAGIALFATQPLQQAGDPAMPADSTTLQAANSDEAGAADGFLMASRGDMVIDRTRMPTSANMRNVVTQQEADAHEGRWQAANPQLANRLHDYLIEHKGMARAYGLGATTPGFVRVAAYGQESIR